MIVLGVVLLVLGWLAGISILTWLGVILLVVGLVFLVVGRSHPIGGRTHWY